jgi:hypothetical protein
MIVLGIGLGFVFAAAVLAMSVVAFLLLVERNVGVPAAMATSVAGTWKNPRTVAAWARDRRRLAGHRRGTGALRPRFRAAGPRPRHLAPQPPHGGATARLSRPAAQFGAGRPLRFPAPLALPHSLCGLHRARVAHPTRR